MLNVILCNFEIVRAGEQLYHPTYFTQLKFTIIRR